MLNILLIVLLIVVALSLRAHRNGQRWAKHVMIVATVIGIGAGGVGIWKYLRKSSKQEAAAKKEAGAGYALGEELRRQLPDGGLVLVVSMPTPASAKKEASDNRSAGFREAFSNSNFKLVIAGPSYLLDEPILETDFIAMPAGELEAKVREWIGTHPETKAVAWLISTPFSPQCGSGRPLFAFVPRDNIRWDWQSAIARGTIKAAMVDEVKSGATNSVGDWKQFYELVTPESLAAYQAGKAKPKP